MKLINLKIDVTKIDKSRLFKGAKGTYLDAQVFLNEDADDYGNHGMITQAVSKEEREAGTRGAILGNAKVVWEDPKPTYNGGQAAPRREQAPPQDQMDDIPF